MNIVNKKCDIMEIPKLSIEEQELLWKAICDYSWYKTLAVNLRYYPSSRVEDRPTSIGMLDMWSREVRLFADIPYDPFTEIRLFLRPLTSMTEKEKEQFFQLMLCGNAVQIIEFYKENHFDYMLLIDKGLAFEATEDMYKHFGDMDVVVTSVEHKDKL